MFEEKEQNISNITIVASDKDIEAHNEVDEILAMIQVNFCS
jgi:hypothetical protein